MKTLMTGIALLLAAWAVSLEVKSHPERYPAFHGSGHQ